MLTKILVIIPAFNEEASLPSLIHEIRQKAPKVEILIIDDHSADRTASLATEAGAHVVTLPFNLGIGGAVQTGYKIAAEENYDIAIQLDGDGQHDPGYIETLIQPLLQGQLDFCIGSRFLIHDESFKSTSLRRIGIGFFRKLLRLMTGINLTDPTSGFRACNRSMITKFAAYYPVDFPEPEAIKMANRLGARIGEVPVQMRARQGGQSSIRYFATLYYMLKVTLAILIDAFKTKPRSSSHAR